MRAGKIKIYMAVMSFTILMSGCVPNSNYSNMANDSANEYGFEDNNEGEERGGVSEDSYNMGKQGSQNDTQSGGAHSGNNNRSQQWSTASAESFENELARYRAERENKQSDYGNYVLSVLPNEENYEYGVGGDCYTGNFDTRELAEVFKTADSYIHDTLHLDSEAWECVDPRMNAILYDEDKGVANGYDSDNIFICEYEDNGKWHYLIIVRKKKGSEWKVLYNGDSYKKYMK